MDLFPAFLTLLPFADAQGNSRPPGFSVRNTEKSFIHGDDCEPCNVPVQQVQLKDVQRGSSSVLFGDGINGAIFINCFFLRKMM